jgi:hypothetical protein
MDTKDSLRGSFTEHASSAKVAWAFVLKSKDYGLEYEKEFPAGMAPTNLKTYRGFEALTCFHKTHIPTIHLSILRVVRIFMFTQDHWL